MLHILQKRALAILLGEDKMTVWCSEDIEVWCSEELDIYSEEN